ncbi:hypothetical protein KR215_000023 [Drosophila sulfurigaster]|uniref:calaxin-like n=1 Tax=Drosophila sulfurigaster albostrigata TaxID=89887 RepID=UPI002D21CFA2|nr:calaxin-like [Drosophila sulfurigaster albostrigata]KAH8396512.1 hypothetical protein KR215_000023 [Drosophila sulfurigaster]
MKDLDLTLDYMENARFNYVYGTAVARMEASIFSTLEKLCISMIYHKFVLREGPRTRYMTVQQLSGFIRMMFKITDPRINHRIVKTISDDPNCVDPKFHPDRHCTLNSFIKMLAIYFSNDLDRRMRFVFSVYDEDGYGFMNRETVMRYIDAFFTGDDEDEIFEMRADMLELLFQKFDKDKDLLISFEEYCDTVRKQPELLEFLGTVFPSKNDLDVVGLCCNLHTH